MISSTRSLPLNLFVIPSLAQIAQRMVRTRNRTAAPVRAAGLSCADIDDASTRATIRNGLTLRPPALREISTL